MHLLRELARGGVSPVVRRTIPIAQPAAQTGFTITPENGRAWQVLSVSVGLTTAIDVANRAVEMALLDGTFALWVVPPTAVQVASTTVMYSWIADYVNAQTVTVGNVQAVGLPPAILLPGWSLTVAALNMAATDQFTAGKAQVLESFVGRTEAEYDLARRIEHRAEAIADALGGEVTGA